MRVCHKRAPQAFARKLLLTIEAKSPLRAPASQLRRSESAKSAGTPRHRCGIAIPAARDSIGG